MSQSNKNQRATIADVAERAGVSIATVSRVLNRTGNVAENTVAGVQAAMRELGYQPNTAARQLASNRTNAIGLLVDEIIGEYFAPMLRGIEMATAQAEYDFLIYSTRRRTPTGSSPLGEHNTDGLLVFADSLPDSELRRLHELSFPVVLLHRIAPPGLSIPCVTVANKSGAYEMASYLIQVRGYRKFAFLTGPPEHEDSYWREKGYREALTNYGLDYNAMLVGNGGFNETQAYETVTQWIRRGLSMEVIVAFDDDSAIGAMAALKEANRRIPDDIAVVGFDDIRLSRYLDPPLTTVRVPIEEVARTAVEILIQVIEAGEVSDLTLLPTELIIRRSCGYQ